MRHQTIQFRRIGQLRYGDALPNDDRQAGDIPIFSSGGQIGWHSEANTRGPAIVIGRKGSYGSVWLSESPAFVIDTAYAIDRFARPTSTRWLYYVLLANDLRSLSQDVGVPGLSRDRVHALGVPDCDLSTQRRVADFLDQETGRIADLADAMSRLDRVRVEGYERMLRDRVGIDNWPLVQIRHVAGTGTGHTPSREHPEYWIAEELVVPWFTLADVWQIRDDEVEVVGDTAERISEVGLANSAAVRHPAGTVVLSRTASVGFSAIMGDDMAVSQDFMTWTCGPELEPFFLLYALRAIRPELRSLMTGSTHKTVYMPDLHALRIPLPPIEAQREAVEAIRGALSPHWELRRRTDELRKRLGEYRDALIAEAVAGQLDVTRVSDAQMDERAHAAMEDERLEAVR